MPPPLTVRFAYEFAVAAGSLGFTSPLSEAADDLPRAMRCDRVANGNSSYIQEQAYDKIINVLRTAGLTMELEPSDVSSSY